MLASKKSTSATIEKGKDAEIKKWEAELRKTLAQKATSPTLSKQDQALVDAQLQKEKVIRERVESIRKSFSDGLHIIKSVLASNAPGLQDYLSSFASILLDDVIKDANALVGTEATYTYLVRFPY